MTTSVRQSAPLPFMTTHIANIALNKLIGLVFILANHQQTSGLTDVSGESLTNDQLAVARWMIGSFLFDCPEDATGDENSTDPWARIKPYRMKLMEFPDPAETAKYEQVLGEIELELESLAQDPWGSVRGRHFLTRLIAQIVECENFTCRRVEIIKLCAKLPDIDEGVMKFRSVLASLGPETESELIKAFGLIGPGGLGPLGYLGVKNSMPAANVFTWRLLPIVRRILVPEAIRRGYAALPTETK